MFEKSLLLTAVLAVLKLCHAISWSWWWVACPLWGPPALGVALALIIFVSATVLNLREG
jgi:hypothetical protein